MVSTAFMIDQKELEALNAALKEAEPREILNKLLDRVPNTAISFSGAEDVLLIELTKKRTNPPSIFTLDTGRLHPETYRYIETVRDHYNRRIEALFPDSVEVNNLITIKGMYSCLLYTSPSPRDGLLSRMPSSA